MPDHWRPSGRQLALLLGATPLLLFAVNRVDDARAALSRFNSVVAVDRPARAGDRLRPRRLQPLLLPARRASPSTAAAIPTRSTFRATASTRTGSAAISSLRRARPGPRARSSPGRRPNVILIVLESTRADAIGRRVDGRPLTPVLDALAARGSAARRAYSHVGFTTDSLQSLFSGTAGARRRPPVAGPRFPRQRLSGRHLFRPGRGFRRHREPRRPAARRESSSTARC